MSYFDDQYEAWLENDCQGDPTEADIADLALANEDNILSVEK